MSNYEEALQFLYDLQRFGSKFGLENTIELARRAGDPQKQLRFIHVAGTNGKGSTCAMLESIYRAAGLKVGLFTSPHLVFFGERIQVNRQLMSEEQIVRGIAEMRSLLSDFPGGFNPTFFEVVTVLALRHFAAAQCDLVVWETGMGGRLDATNIVLPLASVITNVQLDHQRWLGATLAEIAREKAGIIKPAVPVITAEQNPMVVQVLSRVAGEQGAPLVRVTVEDTRRPPLNFMKLPLPGDHQLLNAALACATVEQLQGTIPVASEDLRIGLQRVNWPGRMQVVHRGIGRVLVLDGAHNPAGAEALVAALSKNFPNTLPTFIFAVMQDKDWPAICRIIMPLAGRICLTQVKSDRTESAAALRDFCQQINPYAEAVVCGSLADALNQTEHDSLVVITGSIQFVGEAIEQLGLSPAPARNERGLNDYVRPAP